MRVFSLGEFASHLLTMKADVEAAEEAIVVKGCEMVAKRAKQLIGHPQPFWPPLKEETIARKARGNTPLLETGALKDSIEITAPLEEGDATVGYVGSNHPHAIFNELGTRNIPPRPFLSAAGAQVEHDIHEMAGRLYVGAMLHGGPHYRELREVLHALRAAGHVVTEIIEDLSEEDDG